MNSGHSGPGPAGRGRVVLRDGYAATAFERDPVRRRVRITGYSRTTPQTPWTEVHGMDIALTAADDLGQQLIAMAQEGTAT